MSTNKHPGNTAILSAKYKIACSRKLGRYLVAAKNIAAGEVILREEPVVVGPTTFYKNYMCFACMRLIHKLKIQYICSKCNVAPLCGPACEKRIGHHTIEECNLFQSNKNLSTSDYSEIIGILLPLRVWLLKKRDLQIWRKIESMEAHVDKRRDTPVWKDREINVIDVIRKFQLIPMNDRDASEFLQRLCGILDVNTFELRSPEGLGNSLLRGLYTEAALMAHDCRGNTHLTVDDKFQLAIYASISIQKGQTIYFNYTSSLLGAAERREHLREGKYFECDCSVCKDPYELESHLSSISCPRCKKGFVAMQEPLNNDPYGQRTKWQCQKCERLFCGWMIKTTLEITRMLIHDIENTDIKALEALLKKLSRSFHSNHFLMLELKQKLLAGYREKMTLPNPRKEVLQRMLDLYKEVLSILDMVEPGISRLKGIILYEMHLPLALLANRAYRLYEISSKELVSSFEETRSLLKKALTMLLLEPVTTPEGQLAKRALQELKILNQNIADVKSVASREFKE